jgi:hypothetical protein
MVHKTVYVRDEKQWNKAMSLVGKGGMSALVSDLLDSWIARKEREMTSLQKSVEMRDIELPVDDSHSDETEEKIGPHKVVFTGRLLADSAGYSVAQAPRILVYQTQGGKILVYRTFQDSPNAEEGPTFRVYANYEELDRDGLALDTMWIEGDPIEDEGADYTEELQREVARALGQEIVIRVG